MLLNLFNSYAIAYWLIVLNIDGFVAGLAYIVNVFLASLAFGVCTGTIGFLSAYIFVRRLYSSLKVRFLKLRILSSLFTQFDFDFYRWIEYTLIPTQFLAI
jgi:hypothetical protein